MWVWVWVWVWVWMWVMVVSLSSPRVPLPWLLAVHADDDDVPPLVPIGNGKPATSSAAAATAAKPAPAAAGPKPATGSTAKAASSSTAKGAAPAASRPGASTTPASAAGTCARRVMRDECRTRIPSDCWLWVLVPQVTTTCRRWCRWGLRPVRQQLPLLRKPLLRKSRLSPQQQLLLVADLEARPLPRQGSPRRLASSLSRPSLKSRQVHWGNKEITRAAPCS